MDQFIHLQTFYPMRFTNLEGLRNRYNDLIYAKPVDQNKSNATVVYFGGDVQDFTENMQSHRDNKEYIEWNLENTCGILHKSFPDAHIVIVRPARMEYKTFSCFENFVACTTCGAPQHTPTHQSLEHLEALLKSLSNKIHKASIDELENAVKTSRAALIHPDLTKNEEKNDSNKSKNVEVNHETSDFKGKKVAAEINHEDTLKRYLQKWSRTEINLNKNDVKLIGFSKGCVVLNQILHEFAYPEINADSKHFISRIKDMYWLDGGHSGGKNTWITSKNILKTFSTLGIRVHIHVTPYQIQDDRRPWIKKEEKGFYEYLSHSGVNVNRKLHFENLTPSLDVHFNVLHEFNNT